MGERGRTPPQYSFRPPLETVEEHRPSFSPSPAAGQRRCRTSSPSISHVRQSAPVAPVQRPPKARHPTAGIDPEFLSEAMTQRPGVGLVYDWHEHHRQNEYIVQQRKQQRRHLQVQGALQKEVEVRQNGEALYQQWLAMKQVEQRCRAQYIATTLRACALPPVTQMPEVEAKWREAGWQRSVVIGKGGLLGRDKAMKKQAAIVNLQKSWA